MKRKVSGDGSGALSRRWPAMALHLAVRPARSEIARGLGDAAAVRRQARHLRGSVHVQMGGECADRAGQRAGRGGLLARLGFAAPIAMTVAYGGMRILMAVLTQLRDGVFAKVPMHAMRGWRSHLRACPPALAALPSGAQDRRPVPRDRARQQGHRDHRSHRDPSAPADHRRARCCIAVVLLYQFDWRYVLAIIVMVALYMWFTSIAPLAHLDPPPHEPQRPGRQHQGGRLAAQLRDGKYFNTEEHETRRFDRSMERYERASVSSYCR